MLRRLDQDIIIQAAAPADYRPADPSSQKIKKREGQPLTLQLVETPDVAAAVGSRKRPGQVLVVFAAETERVVEHAREKLLRKAADLVVANDITQPGAGFNVDTNLVTFITAETAEALPLLSKHDVADALLTRVAALRRG
jgi:phosphopantothenoylcysteine decarboxylase/phosphopantothenate--cysteine ligase